MKGLVNMGNKCYLNSVIQCLCYTLRTDVIIPRTNLGISLVILFKKLKQKENENIPETCEKIIKLLDIKGNLPEDANQYYIKILDFLFENGDKDLISCYYGELTDMICCPNCNYTSNKNIKFNNLNIYMTNEKLNKSIQTFFNQEIIDYKCEKCENNKCIKKYKSEMNNFPQILVFNLTKVKSRINIKSKFLRFNNGCYSLKSFIGYTNGHYLSCIIEDDKYYLLNDSSVKQINETRFVDLLQSMSTMLFYEIIS